MKWQSELAQGYLAGWRPALILAAVMFAVVACAQPEGRDDDKSDEVIGSPPSADEDPFFVEGTPDDAERAEARGSIGDDREQAEGRRRCFSCVKICPTKGECDNSSAEVICGWGVHEEAEEAKKRARAECDAALEMSRYMPVWSEIEGQCPAATCQ